MFIQVPAACVITFLLLSHLLFMSPILHLDLTGRHLTAAISATSSHPPGRF
jgi:hypothetical protein